MNSSFMSSQAPNKGMELTCQIVPFLHSQTSRELALAAELGR
jgi:hypothetical protein